MSATANIITDTTTGLVVPSSAVKTAGSTNYVLVFDPAITVDSSSTSGTATDQTPKRVDVTVGLAGDTETVILTGLTGGEQVVTKTTGSTPSTSSSPSQTTTQTRGFGGPGGIGL